MGSSKCWLLVVFALGTLGAAAGDWTSTADARCAAVSLGADVARSNFVVEARVETAGDVATFRTLSAWKGGDAAPARFALRSVARGVSPWPRADSVGRMYLLMLNGSGGDVRVGRCGRSGPMTDALRAELLALGLTPTPRS